MRICECAYISMNEALRLIPRAALSAGSKVRIWGWEDAWEWRMGHGLVPWGPWGGINLTCSTPPQAHERLEETKLRQCGTTTWSWCRGPADLAQLAEQSSTAAELARILQEPHFQVWPSPGSPAGAIGS